MALNLTDGVKRLNPGAYIDKDRGPYADRATALAAVPLVLRSEDQKISYYENGKIETYKFVGGIADANLVHENLELKNRIDALSSGDLGPIYPEVVSGTLAGIKVDDTPTYAAPSVDGRYYPKSAGTYRFDDGAGGTVDIEVTEADRTNQTVVIYKVGNLYEKDVLPLGFEVPEIPPASPTVTEGDTNAVQGDAVYRFVKDAFFSQEKATVNVFSSNTGFVNNANGITTNSDTAEAIISLDTIDTTLPFRFDFVVKTLNGQDTNNDLNIYIENSGSTDGRSKNRFFVEGDSIRSSIAAANALYLENSVDNDTFQFTLISTGDRVSVYIQPTNKNWNGVLTNSFGADNDGQIAYNSVSRSYTSGGITPFDNIDRIRIVIPVTGTFEILSMHASNTITPPEYGSTTILEPTILNDNLDGQYPSRVISPAGADTLTQYHHPNGSTASIGGVTLPRVAAMLFNNGSTLCYGTFNSYNNPKGTGNLFGAGVTASNWGAPAGMKYRKALQDFCIQFLNPKYQYHLGASMGGLNAVNFAIQYPDNINGVIGVSAALDTETNFSDNNFDDIIKKAFGTAYRSLVTQTGVTPTDDGVNWTKIGDEVYAPVYAEYENPFYDEYDNTVEYVADDVVFVPYTGAITGLYAYVPYKNAGKLAGTPMLFIHGDADAIIPIAQVSGFITEVNSYGGYNVRLVTKSGAGHIVDAVYDEVEMLNFIENQK